MNRRRTRQDFQRQDGTTSLDWGDSSHFSHTPGRCQYCGRPTNLRDSDGNASHKTCAETNNGY